MIADVYIAELEPTRGKVGQFPLKFPSPNERCPTWKTTEISIACLWPGYDFKALRTWEILIKISPFPNIITARCALLWWVTLTNEPFTPNTGSVYGRLGMFAACRTTRSIQHTRNLALLVSMLSLTPCNGLFFKNAPDYLNTLLYRWACKETEVLSPPHILISLDKVLRFTFFPKLKFLS